MKKPRGLAVAGKFPATKPASASSGGYDAKWWAVVSVTRTTLLLSSALRGPLVAKERGMSALLIARFDGDVEELTRSYDRAHALIMSRGGATSFGELRHHCAVGDGALYIVGVWDSAEHARTRWSSDGLEKVLAEGGFPSPKSADLTILELHAVEPPL